MKKHKFIIGLFVIVTLFATALISVWLPLKTEVVTIHRKDIIRNRAFAGILETKNGYFVDCVDICCQFWLSAVDRIEVKKVEYIFYTSIKPIKND